MKYSNAVELFWFHFLHDEFKWNRNERRWNRHVNSVRNGKRLSLNKYGIFVSTLSYRRGTHFDSQKISMMRRYICHLSGGLTAFTKIILYIFSWRRCKGQQVWISFIQVFYSTSNEGKLAVHCSSNARAINLNTIYVWNTYINWYSYFYLQLFVDENVAQKTETWIK